MFEEYDKEIREKVTRARVSYDSKIAAKELIKQIIEIENAKDAEHIQLLAEKHIYRNGESAVSFHLKALKELIEKI